MSTLKSTRDLAFPEGSLILVTGSTGQIGSNVVQEALTAGFRVRGVVRSEEKGNKSKELHGNHANYETFVVPDMSVDGAYDKAMHEVQAIIHLATISSFSSKPDEVVPPTVDAALGIMKSALKEPSIKRFVYTSSSVAATFPKTGVKFHIDKNTWNHDALEYADPKRVIDKPENAFPVYAASKYKAEQAVWDFVKREKPNFVVNAILPNTNFGRLLGSAGLTGQVLLDLYNKGEIADWLGPQYFIDVVDNARIHVAAAIDKTVSNERIFTFAEPFNYSDLIAIIKKFKPSRKLPEPPKDEGMDLSTVDNELGAELLRKWFGQDDYKSLEQSVEESLADEKWLDS